MGFFDIFFRAKVAEANGGSLVFFGTSPGMIPVPDVTAQTAKTLAAVYASVHAYSDGISSLSVMPCTPDKQYTPIPAHPLTPMFAARLDDELTNQQAFAFWLDSLMLRGNAYGHIRRDGGGRPRMVTPLDPDAVRPARVTGAIQYAVTNTVTQFKEVPRIIPAADMVHVHINYQPRTLMGIGPVGYAKATIAGGLSQDNFALQFFTQGAQPRCMLEHPAKLSEAQAREIVERFNADHAGQGNAQKTGILTGGVKLHILTMAPDEAQFLESRQFTVNEIARWFNLPASRIGGNRASGTYANLEQDQLAFVTHSIRPVCKMFEGEFNRKLLTPADPTQIRFDLSEILENPVAAAA